MPPPSTDVERLHIVTYNMTCAVFRDELRLPKAVEVLEQQRADVYLLQEVSRACLKELREARWVQAGYHVSDVNGNTFRDNKDGLVRFLLVNPFRSLSGGALC